MKSGPCTVISASRRTDIPAFYMKWFMERIEKGFFETINPYNRVKKIIDVSRNNIHSIVFWSKNFRPFIESGAGEKLQNTGYNLFFNFTINSQSKLLEPNIPPLEERLLQLEELCRKFTPEAVNWRFDPICFFLLDSGNKTSLIDRNSGNNINEKNIENNLADFENIAERAGQYGISRCITSFTDDYLKIKKRIDYLRSKGQNSPDLVFPDKAKKIEIVLWMEKLLKARGISLFTCCEKEILPLLPKKSGILPSACIPGKFLKQKFGGSPETKRDYGQRSKKGCQCTKSIDIGSYDLHPCFHNCLFCYANPSVDVEIKLKRAGKNKKKC